MTTVTDVTTQATSGQTHIDALLDAGPGWNWIAPVRNTLYYTFALDNGNSNDIGTNISAAPVAFNATQQAAAAQALNRLSQITGITFAATNDGAAADFHFGAANIIAASTTGLASTRFSYSHSGGTISTYSADAYIYLDNAEFAASNSAPSAGTAGYEVLLHELGHAMGLKHPFAGSVQLAGAEDNTANTLMSYTHVGGPYSDYSPYDIAALMFLFGGDGLAGALGHGSSGLYLTGTAGGNTLGGGSGNDVLEGKAGNDTINGGAGSDTAAFAGNRALYSFSTSVGVTTVIGPDGTDSLSAIEFLRFADQTVPVGAVGGGNNAPTGSLSITGTVQQGNVLAISSTLTDADGLGTLAYRWQSSTDGNSWSTISGATSATFTPTQAHVGLRLRVEGSYLDGLGTAETVNGVATNPVSNVNDLPTGAVTVVGTARLGVTLNAGLSLADADGLGTVSLRWQQSANGSTWADIAGATGSQYTPGASQVGLSLRAVASYLDGQGTAESVPSASTAAVLPGNRSPTGALALSGTAQQGAALTATSTLADADGLGALAIRWQTSSDGLTWSDIAGATALSVTLGEPQVGRQVRAIASYVDGQGTSETVPSAASAVVANVNDPPTGGVSVSGLPLQGNLLSANSTLADADGLGTLAWRWQSSADGSAWADIVGATAGLFSPAQAHVGLRLRVVGSYLDGHGTAESATSSASDPVVNSNDAPTGSVVVSGTANTGQVLTATQTLADADGLGALTVNWQTSSNGLTWTTIAGATGDTFTLGLAQVGLRLRAQISYLDGHGTNEVVSSSATAAVTSVNAAPSGQVTVQGTAKVGQALQATAALADANGLGALSYEWQQSSTGSTWQAISGATSSSFTPSAAQAGLLLRVMVRYTDGLGTAESVPSLATLAVQSVINGTGGNDVLNGSASVDEINGLAGNDRLTGASGSDSLNGGDGIDTAAFAGTRAGYTVLVGAGGSITVQASTGTDGTDNLVQIERLAFSDHSLAFDLAGHAGTTARFLGAVFGKASVANKEYAGIGLSMLDSGTSTAALMQLALEVRLGAGFTPEALVDTLYSNLVGALPPAAEQAFWVGTLTSGQFTPVTLALMAADLDLNAQNIDLVGLTSGGLGFV